MCVDATLRSRLTASVFGQLESAGAFGADNYYEQEFDQYNNIVVNDDRGTHREATAGRGKFGSRQYADSQSADYLQGINESNVEKGPERSVPRKP